MERVYWPIKIEKTKEKREKTKNFSTFLNFIKLLFSKLFLLPASQICSNPKFIQILLKYSKFIKIRNLLKCWNNTKTFRVFRNFPVNTIQA